MKTNGVWKEIDCYRFWKLENKTELLSANIIYNYFQSSDPKIKILETYVQLPTLWDLTSDAHNLLM